MKRKRSLIAVQLSSQRKSMVLLGFASLALGAAIISQAALLSATVNRLFVMKATLSSIGVMLGALLVVMLVRTLLGYMNGRIGLKMAAHVKKAMRSELLHKLVNDSLPTARGGQTGSKVSVMLDAVDEADSYFSQYLPRMIEAAIIPLMIAVAVFTQHYPSGLILLVTAPFIPIFMVLVGLKTKKKSEEKFDQLAEFSGTFLDSLQGLVTLKLYGRVRHQEQAIKQSSLAFRDATMGILRIAFTNTFMLELIVMLSIGLVSLELAIQLLVYKSMSFDTAFFVLLLVPEFFSLLKNTGVAFHSGRTSMGAVRKVEDLLETSNEDKRDRNTMDAADKLDVDRMTTHPMPPSIELKHVRFRYGAGSFELAADSFTIAPGQKLAIVGKSGSGKTTMLHLIAGLLRPLSGEVLVNGQPITNDGDAYWSERVSYITQHPYLFAGTIADNIAIGTKRAVTRSEIEQAAASAGLSTLISELEKGCDTLVGEGGRGLSGGERQRLALARAFLNRPAIILFDEPTVGLDLQTERVLQRSIGELAKQATMITVAHRLYTIRDADRIVFLENGVLLDSGRHEELVSRLPQYAEMVDIQRKGRLG
ncbi:thiol reductant ABC exporter subunit CydD [Paenibacillus sp. 1011MAR3C5]|uniref:thiol reductant ABC exporter subunit CydD n=1 Tax=Paenibacillus sp. 1011MAR3C5 TaxID=1675787 RepID=UPI000E6CA926|nr:thiol reductant ABC exporter subunit CydD [Paenibacillus sp. 1011MAR3C5]RJE87024.1 thiol reductant ABC exporter subunit CydD [Paenibacillus sp. 1011MAR3C5]